LCYPNPLSERGLEFAYSDPGKDHLYLVNFEHKHRKPGSRLIRDRLDSLLVRRNCHQDAISIALDDNRSLAAYMYEEPGKAHIYFGRMASTTK
jgi:hypothetical protein